MNFFLFALAVLPAVLAIPASPPNPSQYGSTGPYGSSGYGRGAGTPSNSNSNNPYSGSYYPHQGAGTPSNSWTNHQGAGTPSNSNSNNPSSYYPHQGAGTPSNSGTNHQGAGTPSNSWSNNQGAGTPSNSWSDNYERANIPSSSNWGLSSGPIYPNFNSGKCLDVQGGVQANGTPVQIYDCNGSGAQQWTMLPNGQSGPTKVQLSNTNYCLDVGLTPGDGTQMKIWTCIDDGSAPQQDFFYTADDRIASPHNSFCLDLTGGVLDNGNPVQIWTCSDNNLNQVWTRRG